MNKKNFFESNPNISILLILIFGMLLLDVLFTLLYKTFINNPNDYIRNFGTSHPIYHHTLKKNYSQDVKFRQRKYSVHTNSLGFKDSQQRIVPLDTNLHRIVFIGDSFTEGVTYDYGDTFVGKIDSAFNEIGIDVLNAGRSSYSPIIYWRKIKHLIEVEKLKFDELIVFIDISDVQDEVNRYDLDIDSSVINKSFVNELKISEEKNMLSKIRYFISHYTTITRYSIKFLFYERFTLSGQKQKQYRLKKKEHFNNSDYWFLYTKKSYNRDKWTIDDHVYKDYAEEGLLKMKKYMNSLNRLLKKNNIDLTIAVYPWPSQIWYGDLNSKQVRIWESWAKENDVQFLNYFPFFINEKNTVQDAKETLNKYYIKGDCHFNKQGNKKLYQGFIDFYTPMKN